MIALQATSYKLQANRGQAMLLTVMILSGAILGATMIVGLLMLYEIRNTADVVNSGKALGAADSGIQCALLRHKEITDSGSSSRDCGAHGRPISLVDGVTYYVQDVINPSSRSVTGAESTGLSRGVARSFSVSF